MSATRPIEERLSENFVVDESGCHVWTAGKCRSGYGRIRFGSSIKQAHRIAYELKFGPIQEGLCLDHLCRNRSCINPDHLRPVTWRENTLAPGSESLTKMYADRTHCKHGHELTPDNLESYPLRTRGVRMCKECGYRRQREYQQRKKAVA